MRQWLTITLAAFFAVPAGWAANNGPARIGTLVVPMDTASEPLTLKLETYVNDALREFSALHVKSTDELFGTLPDDEAAAAFKRAEAAYKEGRAAYEAKNPEDAEKKLRAAVKEYGKAASVMKGCGNLCDAVAMLAATVHGRGDLEEAKFILLDLIALGNPDLDRKRFSGEIVALKALAAGSHNAQLRGSLQVKSRPAGGRVFVNGEFQGFAPTTIQTLPTGKTLVRVERPGFRPAGAVIEIQPEDQDVSLELVASPAFKTYDGLADKLATEAIKDKGGSTMASVAKSFGLDRGLIVVVKENDTEVEMALGYYDLKSGRRLGYRRTSFHGDEYGQLKGELQRLVTALVNNAEGNGEKMVRSADPLDNKGGMEEWNSEDKGGRTGARDKGKKGDPLEGVKGTEDW